MKKRLSARIIYRNLQEANLAEAVLPMLCSPAKKANDGFLAESRSFHAGSTVSRGKRKSRTETRSMSSNNI